MLLFDSNINVSDKERVFIFLGFWNLCGYVGFLECYIIWYYNI